jgi:hypothetical protein
MSTLELGCGQVSSRAHAGEVLRHPLRRSAALTSQRLSDLLPAGRGSSHLSVHWREGGQELFVLGH